MNARSQGSVGLGRVLGESRGAVLGELCRKPQTAAELAMIVQTSANSVRGHLDALEEAGLVAYTVERRGVGKPTHVYAITPAAESLLSRAYAPVLAAILSNVRSRLNGDFLPMLRDAGNALALSGEIGNDRENGLRAARSFLESLGTPTEVTQSDGTTVLRASCCPLGAVTQDHTEVCAMIETALSAASGMKARARCVREGRPKCAFELLTP
jgi:predicted ArsR family transcriptional regulator